MCYFFGGNFFRKRTKSCLVNYTGSPNRNNYRIYCRQLSKLTLWPDKLKYTHVCVCTQTYTGLCTHKYTHVSVHTNIHTFVYTQIYTRLCAYKYTHVHTKLILHLRYTDEDRKSKTIAEQWGRCYFSYIFRWVYKGCKKGLYYYFLFEN